MTTFCIAFCASYLSTVYTVFRFVWVGAKFGTCTVVIVNETNFEAKMGTFTLESTHFIFNKCPFYTHDGESAKFSTSRDERITISTLALPIQW